MQEHLLLLLASGPSESLSASFTDDHPGTVYTDSLIHFTSTSTGSIINWTWEINNGSGWTFLSNTENTSHTFEAGTWSVRLTVQDGVDSDTYTATNLFTSYAHLAAAFTADDHTPSSSQNVNFTDTSSGNPTTWLWEYSLAAANDWSTFSTDQNPYRSFAPGTYDIRLTVSNPRESDQVTQSSLLDVREGITADFMASSTLVEPGDFINFTDTSTGPSLSFWSWYYSLNGTDWTFFSGLQNPTGVTFVSEGKYWIKVLVTNLTDSDEEIKSEYIEVAYIPVPDFTYDPSSGEAPLEVTFTNTTTHGLTYTWWYDYGAGFTQFSSETNPVYIFSEPGTYSIRLIAANGSQLAVETKTNIITVLANVSALFSFNQYTDPQWPDYNWEYSTSIDFTDTSSGSPNTWLWEYNNGGGWTSFSTSQNPGSLFPAGTYSIRLTASNGGTPDTYTITDAFEVKWSPLSTGSLSTMTYATNTTCYSDNPPSILCSSPDSDTVATLTPVLGTGTGFLQTGSEKPTYEGSEGIAIKGTNGSNYMATYGGAGNITADGTGGNEFTLILFCHVTDQPLQLMGRNDSSGFGPLIAVNLYAGGQVNIYDDSLNGSDVAGTSENTHFVIWLWRKTTDDRVYMRATGLATAYEFVTDMTFTITTLGGIHPDVGYGSDPAGRFKGHIHLSAGIAPGDALGVKLADWLNMFGYNL